MRQVIPNLLWIGSVGDVDNISHVFDAGIEALVDLAMNEKPAHLTRDLIYCRFPMVDGGGNSPKLLRASVCTVERLIADHIPTLVYCSAGMSRSVAVVAMALAKHRAADPDETLVELVIDRPHDVSPLLWSDLYKACLE
jgi:protein-tyrosine phosphatase